MFTTFSRFHRCLIVSAVMLTGVLASLLAGLYVHRVEAQRTRLMFERRAGTQAEFARAKLQGYEEMIHSLRNFVLGSEYVSRAEFAIFTRDLLSRHAGVQALQWVPLVSAAARAEIEATATRETGRPFHFRRQDAAGQWQQAGDQPAYLPILYVEPLAGNEVALGYDLLSAVTKDTLIRARAQRQLLATPQIQLVQAPKGRLGVVFILPVFKPAPAGSEAFVGYVQGVFIARTMLAEAHREQPDAALDVVYADVTDSAPAPTPIYRNIGGSAAAAGTPLASTRSIVHRQRLKVGGRQWEMTAVPTPAWLAQQKTSLPWLMLTSGLFTSGLAGLLVHMLLRHSLRVEREVANRTAELHHAQELLHEDIRQRIAAESELQESRRQLSNLISQLPGAAVRCAFDEHLTASFASEGMLALTGYPAADFVAGRIHIASFTLPEDQHAMRATVAGAIREHRAFEVEYRITHRDGTVKSLLVRGRPVYAETGTLRFLECLAIDISALKQSEAQKLAIERILLETQKLESLGVFAGGIAHDFNNILTAILGNASLARLQNPHGPTVAQLLQIEMSARRAADLCKQLLAYAGRDKTVMTCTSLSELVRDTTALLRVLVHQNTQLTLQLAPDTFAVQCDPTQLRQVVMNLIMNATDAIGAQPGTIHVATFVREADAALLRTALHRPDLPGGTYVGLEVTDTGCGMTPAILARIFEPFFSTKFTGRGLGLSASLGIVQAHNGALFAESSPGKGTTFRLLLPAVPAGTARSPAALPPIKPLRGTILIVDDEEAVRAIAGALLKAHGLDTLAAPDGETALRLYLANRDRIDLVLLDLTMPGIPGDETLRRLRALNPRQRIIVMSGYGETEAMQRCAELPDVAFLQKPFEIRALLDKLRHSLG